MKFNRETVAERFKKHPILTVVFTKANGDERVMRCTQSLDLIPKDKHPKDKHPKGDRKEPSDTVCNVFELEVGWRSFKYENVISIH